MPAAPAKLLAAIRKHALALPETREDHPWGETVFKVRGKVFVFAGAGGEEAGLGVKLPRSGLAALKLPGVSPMGYGLGRSGWVHAVWAKTKKDLPLDLVRAWIDESYRAVAPRSIVAQLDAPAEVAKAPARKAKKKAAAKRSRR